MEDVGDEGGRAAFVATGGRGRVGTAAGDVGEVDGGERESVDAAEVDGMEEGAGGPDEGDARFVFVVARVLANAEESGSGRGGGKRKGRAVERDADVGSGGVQVAESAGRCGRKNGEGIA